MEFAETKDRSDDLINRLTEVWESSVKATHLFLSDADITNIKKYVPQLLREVKYLLVAWENEQAVGFLGTENGSLEMLFLAPESRGKGLGRRMTEYAVKNYNIKEVTVNEQNPQAIGFYERMGFRVYKRTETDEQGNPYPLLYMRLD